MIPFCHFCRWRYANGTVKMRPTSVPLYICDQCAAWYRFPPERLRNFKKKEGWYDIKIEEVTDGKI